MTTRQVTQLIIPIGIAAVITWRIFFHGEGGLMETFKLTLIYGMSERTFFHLTDALLHPNALFRGLRDLKSLLDVLRLIKYRCRLKATLMDRLDISAVDFQKGNGGDGDDGEQDGIQILVGLKVFVVCRMNKDGHEWSTVVMVHRKPVN